MVGFKKKNLTALALVAVLLASGIGAYKAQAAKQIEENRDCSVTFMTQPDSKVTTDITISLYKIADVELNGQYSNKLDGVKFDLIKDGQLATDDVDAFVQSASGAVKNVTPITEKILAGQTSVKFDKVPRGLYLYVPSAPNSNRYKYTFTSSVISVPSSNYIQGGTTVDANGNIVQGTLTDDNWNYELKVAVKSEAEQRYGYLRIDKNLTRYNESLGTASFVYTVEATLDNKTVYSNVFSLNIDYLDEYTAEDNFIWVAGEDGSPILPADAVVTVTEENTGASYKLTASSITNNSVIKASDNNSYDNVTIATFTNDYDNELQVGGISVINSYKLNASKTEYEFDGNNLVEEEVAR